MEIHAIREHFLDITNLDRHVWRKHFAVYLNLRRIDIVETPNPEMPDWLGEFTASVEVWRSILLDCLYIETKQIWSTNNISLKLHIERGLCPIVVVYV